MNKEINLRILIGLPASGKSTFANEYQRTTPRRVEVFGENECQLSWNSPLDTRCQPLEPLMLKKRLENNLVYCSDTLIVDGLYLTTESVLHVINSVAAVAKLKTVTLDYWPENKEECLRNDYLRRRIGSALSIENLHIDVDFKIIKEKYPETVVETHEVYHTPDYVLYFREHGLRDLKDERYLYSSEWLISGESWSYKGNRYPLDPDEPLSEFSELEDLLDSISPSITRSESRKIYSICVETNQIEHHDYYLRTTNAQFVCDLEKLYQTLDQMGYLKKPDVFTEEEKSLLHEIQKKSIGEMTDLERLCYKLARGSFSKIEL